MKSSRLHSLDFIRAGSFLLIFVYHYMVELEAVGLFDFGSRGIFYENDNLNMARIGVVLFFMLSGFGLMKSSMRKGEEPFSVKEYAKKRFAKILIPYYAVSFLLFAGMMVIDHGKTFAGKNIPIVNVLFTVLGLDGYLKEYGVATFHFGVGEWFVGCMLLMYVVFPLLKVAMSKKAELTLGIATICYIAVVYLYKGDVPSYYFFPVKLYDFVLGMYLAKKLDVPVKKWSLVFCLAWIAMVLIPWNLPIDENFLNVICSLCVFLGFYHLEDVTAGNVLMGNNGVRILADCSYEMFLVHHWGIILMSQILGPTTLPTAVLYLAAELVVVVLIGFVLHYVISQLLFYIRQGSFRISS